MSESVRAGESAKSEARCPFCHAAIAPDASDAGAARISCAACKAPHHAECFVEHTKCAATGCGSPEVLVGDEVIPVGVLSAKLDKGERVAREGRSGFQLLLLPLMAFAVAFVLMAIDFNHAAFLTAVVGAVLLLTLGIVFIFMPKSRPRVHVEPAQPPDPIMKDAALNKIWPGIFESADPYEPIRRRIEREEGAPEPEAPTATAPQGESPSRCHGCGQTLDAEGEGEALKFCYHCGVSLA